MAESVASASSTTPSCTDTISILGASYALCGVEKRLGRRLVLLSACMLSLSSLLVFHLLFLSGSAATSRAIPTALLVDALLGCMCCYILYVHPRSRPLYRDKHPISTSSIRVLLRVWLCLLIFLSVPLLQSTIGQVRL